MLVTDRSGDCGGTARHVVDGCGKPADVTCWRQAEAVKPEAGRLVFGRPEGRAEQPCPSPAADVSERSPAWLDGEDAGVAVAEPHGTPVAGQRARLEAGRGQVVDHVLARI